MARRSTRIVEAEKARQYFSPESSDDDDEVIGIRRSGRNAQSTKRKYFSGSDDDQVQSDSLPPSAKKLLSGKNKEIKKKGPIKVEVKDETLSESEEEDTSPTEKGMSEYERQILQNIEDRKKMFEMLKLDEAKNDLANILKPARASSPQKNGRPKNSRGFAVKSSPPETPVLRMTLRSRIKMDEHSEEKGKKEEIIYATPVKRRPTGILTLSNTYQDQDAVEDSTKFVEDMIPLLEKENELEKLPSDVQNFLKLMKSFTINENGVARVLKSRIYSMAWHPSACKLLLAAGDRDGSIGFWDIDQHEDLHNGVRAYDVHKKPVNCLSFDFFNPTRLLSTSYDGFVRRLDLKTNIFDEVYSMKITKGTWTSYHAQRDPSTILVSQSNGEVLVLDVRTSPSTIERSIQCFENSARTLSIHPQEDHLFLTCNRYGNVGMFDLRYAGKGEDLAVPVVSFVKCSKGVHNAFFSPISGKYALTTCMDHTLKVYDLQDKAPEAKCMTVITHNNYTGRWLAPFKAVWHPQREDVFAVGSMEQQPRRIELFRAEDGQLLHNFQGKDLGSICSVNTFHPTVPILAGANSSGRVHIFRPT